MQFFCSHHFDSKKKKPGKATHFLKLRPLPRFFFFVFNVYTTRCIVTEIQNSYIFCIKNMTTALFQTLSFVTLFLEKYCSENCFLSAHPTDLWAGIWTTLTLSAKINLPDTQVSVEVCLFKNKEIRSDIRTYFTCYWPTGMLSDIPFVSMRLY